MISPAAHLPNGFVIGARQTKDLLDTVKRDFDSPVKILVSLILTSQ